MRRVLLNGWVAMLGIASTAHADQAEEPIRIEYRVPPRCPTEEAFVLHLRARTLRARLATEGERARLFAITVVSGNQESRGHLTIRDPDGHEAERDVAGATCDEVIAALALITALAVDPGALTRPADPPATPSEPPAPPTADHASAAPVSGAPATPTRPPPAAVNPALHGDEWAFAFTANVGLASGISPRVVVGFPLFVEAASPAHGLFAPTRRLGFERAASGAIDVQAATANFTWTVGIAEACPTRWTFGALSFEPCARAEAGVLEGSGGNIVPPRADTRPWIAMGAGGHAKWFVLSPLFLDLEAGIRLPFIRTRYFFVPDITIYQPAAVGWTASVGAGVRFL